MLFYIGQFDGYDGVNGQQELWSLFEWDAKQAFLEAPQWKYITAAFLQAGYFKQVANFTWVVLSGAGHMAPADQPDNTLDLISDYI